MSGDKKNVKLPRFESIDDLAAFFDSHSTEEFEWEPVDAVAGRPRLHVIHPHDPPASRVSMRNPSG